MGFSVSGSAAIIFASVFIAFGMFHAAATNGFETVTDAQEDRSDRLLDRQNTAINITEASYDQGTGQLTVNVSNEGSSQLAVSSADLLLDNDYVSGYATAVDGNAETDLWLPLETLELTVDVSGPVPDRAKVVVETGRSDVEPVVVV